MLTKTPYIVWAAGKEAYHLQQCLKNFPEPAVLHAFAEELQNKGLAENYTHGMRRAVEIVEYQRHVQNGVTIARDVHMRLKHTDGSQGLHSWESTPAR
jgi:hypothetical protein